MFGFLSAVFENFMRVCFIGVIVGVFFAYIPKKVFEFLDKLLKPFKFEEKGKFYEKYFKISKWKDKLPQFSNLVKVGFRLDNIEINSYDYLERFKLETIRSEITHIFLMLISPVFIHFNDNLLYGILTSCIYFIGNIPFLMIQRYNRPRIEHLDEMIKKRKFKSEQKREKIRKTE